VSATRELIAKYRVGGDDDIAVCVLPNATTLIATADGRPLRETSPSVRTKLFRAASDIAMLAYEAMQAHGTNILGRDDEGYYLVIARTEEDGLPLRWNPGKSSPKELGDLAAKMKDHAWTIGKRDVTDSERPLIEEAKVVALPKTTSSVTVGKPPVQEPETANNELERADTHPPGGHQDRDLGDVASDVQKNIRKGPVHESDYRIRHLTKRR
jgi:hypothetical protein